MPQWLETVLQKSSLFMPHGHCYLWIPSLLWLHVLSDLMIGIAYLGISLLLYSFVRKIRLPFSPVFIAFGLFIGLCGLTHFMSVWTVWNPDYLVDGILKAATAAASVATAIGLFFIRPQIEAVVHTARLSEERRIQLETKNAELELLYKKIKEIDEQKSQFFANVSHELRTPLALILGPIERMASDSNLTNDQKNQLAAIERHSKTLLKHVNDLLDIAKLEAGGMAVRYARFDVAHWLRRVASQFEFIAQQRSVTYRVTAPDTLVVQADVEMLERILVNLLSNAFKFTPEGGEVDVALESEKDLFQIAVKDSGPGIHPDQQEMIFERFRQADGGATRTHGGTGLGLAIVKELVELQQGEVIVQSKLGFGAKFVVQLPAHAPDGATIVGTSEMLRGVTHVAVEATIQELVPVTESSDVSVDVSQAAQRPKVLVVEDNRDMARFVADILQEHYHVVPAADGQEGLERALALLPDLIVTDVMMPRMSGDQLVAELRRNPVFAATPILLLTAKYDDALRIRMLRMGAQDYLTKPFQAAELVARAGNLIATKRAGDSLRTTLALASSDLEALAKEIALRHRQLSVAFDAAQVAKEQAHRAAQVKGQFLAMVSHELRTPVSTIRMSTQLLDRLSPPAVPAWYAQVMERLRRATTQMASLIEGLLEYTRVESGKIDLQIEPFDLQEIASDVIQAHGEHGSSGVDLVLEPATAGHLKIESDARLVRVILANLISNALKFTKEGRVTVRIEATNDWHILEVQDTGIGINEADLPRIFEPFEQLEPVKRKSIPGVGLGLALVKQLVELLQGRIEIKSVPSQGSTFRVLLPSRLKLEQHRTPAAVE